MEWLQSSSQYGVPIFRSYGTRASIPFNRYPSRITQIASQGSIFNQTKYPIGHCCGVSSPIVKPR